MHKIKFFPLGNADGCLITTTGGSKLLFDFGNERDSNNKDDKRADLAVEVRADLQASKKDSVDVLGITHLDDDHVCGAPAFFYLEHAGKYQSKDRIKIDEMWVPAAVIIEDRPDGDAGVIQAEARHRLINKKGIRVFSRPDRLREWLSKRNLNIDDYKDIITDAGRVVSRYQLGNDGIEFFVHSPFAEHCDDKMIDRNEASMVLQARFSVEGKVSEMILGSDTTHEVWSSIVNVTKYHKREDRLRWNLFKLPHHCSFLSLNADKGKEKTTPNDEVRWLYETQGQTGSFIVSTSDPIPSEDTIQPPHLQAANYYKSILADKDGRFIVTMAEPNTSNPSPITFEVTKDGIRFSATSTSTAAQKGVLGAIAAARETPAPPAQRVGFGRS